MKELNGNETRELHVNCTVSAARKAIWVRAARLRKERLTKFACDALDERAKQVLKGDVYS